MTICDDTALILLLLRNIEQPSLLSDTCFLDQYLLFYDFAIAGRYLEARAGWLRRKHPLISQRAQLWQEKVVVVVVFLHSNDIWSVLRDFAKELRRFSA